jgi:hypothetical protein
VRRDMHSKHTRAEVACPCKSLKVHDFGGDADVVRYGIPVASTAATMRVAAACVLVVFASVASGQQPPAVAGTPTPPDDTCAKAVTIYLDASGTMTQPVRNRGSRLPISDVAQTLLRFISAENFLTATDTVTIKYFGSAVRTQAENRQAAAALLTQLADPASAPATVQALRTGDLRNLTDFSRLFDDIDNRVRNAPSRRQIIFIASDFAHDQLNNPGCPDDVGPRMQSFAAALARIRPRLEALRASAAGASGRVEIAGLFAPEGNCRSDNEVARQVQESLAAIGMRLYRYDEDAAEAALTINNQLTGTVTAQPATLGVARVGADDRVPFLVSNPNCVDASVAGLQFDVGDRVHKVEFEPFVVSGRTQEVRVEVAKLATAWNRDARVTPLIAPGTSLSVEPSATFWLGDWIRIRRLTPYLYPRTFREGEALVEATLERSLQAPGGLTVGGIDAGGRARLFQLPKGEGEELYLLPFNLNAALAARLSAAGATASLGTTGIRLLTDDSTAVANAAWPLTSSATSAAADVVDWVGAGTLFLYGGLFLLIVFSTFSRNADAETGEQIGVLFSRSKKLWVGSGASIALLATRFGTPYIPDIWMFLLTGWRAAATFLAVCFLLRAFLIERVWKGSVEPRLLPADRAVSYRRRWNGVIYFVAFVTALAVLVSFFGPASNPSSGTRIVKGVRK